MEKNEAIREFFANLIEPIVTNAVSGAIPKPKPKQETQLLTVKEVEEGYPISHTQLYREINSGNLTKYKLRSKTIFRKDDVEALFKPECLTGMNGKLTLRTARA